ncbi:MAG: UDP-2,3-diacylglucosamine diphosphatase LpxI [Pseudomonadota bacterium]
MTGSPHLALIAGAGTLPALIAARQPAPPLIVSLSGFLPDGLTPDITFRIEHLGSTLAALREQGIRELCLVGQVRRPVVDPAQIDAATAPIVPRLVAALAQGDDGALRGLMEILEEAGFTLRGAHELAADLLPAPGCLAGAVTEAHERDAARGAEIVAALGTADVGQACIVADGQALAIEALPGTDWMLKSLLVEAPESPDLTDPLGMAADWLSGPAAPRPTATRDPSLPAGGILFKAPKPGQELRADMPTIGPGTVALAAQAGLDGIVLAAGGVLLIEPERCAALAKEAGIFLWVRP